MTESDPIKVYDARWVADEFDDAQIRRLLQSTMVYARCLAVDTVTVARDGRLASPYVAALAVDVAFDMGMRVFVTDRPISTPQSYFTTLWTSQEHANTLGLTITASHNPSEYVGIKFVVPTVRAIGLDCGPMGGLAEVRRIYHSGQAFESASGGTVTTLDLEHDYIDFAMQAAGVSEGELAGLRVVLDAFNGSAGQEMAAGLERAGVRVESLRLEVDGRFPTGSPNPTSRGKMDGAIGMAGDGDVVIGLDGDGDRLVFADRRGVLAAGFAAIPIVEACVENAVSPVPVLYDPKVNPMALAFWSKLGVTPVLFRNGHSQIKEMMQQIGASAAAEESGHYYHRMRMGDLTVSCENSLLTVLLLLAAVHRSPDTLDRLWAMQDRVATTGEFNYQFADDTRRDEAMAAVIDHFAHQGAVATSATPDGVDLAGTVLTHGVDTGDAGMVLQPGWFSGYLRVATNERGVVRSYYSADDADTRDAVESQTREILQGRYGGDVVE